MQAVLDTLSHIALSPGQHAEPQEGLCVMECVAYIAGDKHTDRPSCACPVITEVAIYANDTYIGQLGPALVQRILMLAGSKAEATVTQARSYFLVDYVLRTVLLKTFREHDALVGAILPLPPVTGIEHHPGIERARDAMQHMSHRQAYLFSEMLNGALNALKRRHPEVVAHFMVELLQEVAADVAPADVLALLDGLLAIGAKSVEVTPEMKVRIATLATASDIRLADTSHNSLKETVC